MISETEQKRHGDGDGDGDDDDDPTSRTPPKLSLFSFPSNKVVHKVGILTPPIKALASVPFQWEEAPGKPRSAANDDHDGASNSKPKSTVVRCLELPPRLLNDASKAVGATTSGVNSPTTVLDGPYGGGGGRALSFRSPEKKERSVLFGSLSSSRRWGSSRKSKQEVVGIGDGFDFLFTDVRDLAGGGGGADRGSSHGGRKDGTKVKITRVKKRSASFRVRISHTKSHVLTSIYEGFKQVVPLSWGRRRSKRI